MNAFVNNEQTNLFKKLFKMFNVVQLEKRCLQSIDDIMAHGTVSTVEDNRNSWFKTQGEKNPKYSFIDNGSKILAVAHCDTAIPEPYFGKIKIPDETLIYSPQLDDRLGVYTILDLLPLLNIKVDVLLTEDEEHGCTTAEFFKTDKEYNWIVEFDRHGNDVVSYMYNFKEVEEFFKPGRGTYTDISKMEHLGVKAFNIGVAYHEEHTTRCHMVLADYLDQIGRFLRFYGKYKDKKFVHNQTIITPAQYAMEDETYCPECKKFIADHDIIFDTAKMPRCPDCNGLLEMDNPCWHCTRDYKCDTCPYQYSKIDNDSPRPEMDMWYCELCKRYYWEEECKNDDDILYCPTCNSEMVLS